MSESVFRPEIAVPLALIGGFCFAYSLSSWVRGIYLLILAVLFGGIIGVRLGSGAYPIIFRDVAIVIPLYMAFLASGRVATTIKELPLEIALGLFVIGAWMTLCLFNPTSGSGQALMIGLKVWVFYVPFILVGMALAQSPSKMFKTFRVMLVLGLVACSIGLIQAFLIRIIGYSSAISLFYGTAGAQVTQGYSFFAFGGGVFRIPGTFSFTSQYVGFLHFFLTITIIEANADPDPRFRQLGSAAFYLSLVAAVVSGTKGALITFPIFVMLYVILGLMRLRILVAAPVAVMAGLWALSSIGVDIPSLFSSGVSQTESYAQGFIFQQIERGLQSGAFGNGIGSNTGAARYAALGVDAGLRIGLESYYAKIAAELGWIGLVLFSAFFLAIVGRLGLALLRHRGRQTIATIGPLAIYVLFILISCFKGWALDVDPANVFFWLSLGLIIGTERLVSKPTHAVEEPAAWVRTNHHPIGAGSPRSLL